MNGTVGTSAAIAAMLSEAADRIERRHAETTAENRGESACTTLADNIKDVDELALQYREASQDARDHHRIWIGRTGQAITAVPDTAPRTGYAPGGDSPRRHSALHPGNRRRARKQKTRKSWATSRATGARIRTRHSGQPSTDRDRPSLKSP